MNRGNIYLVILCILSHNSHNTILRKVLLFPFTYKIVFLVAKILISGKLKFNEVKTQKAKTNFKPKPFYNRTHTLINVLTELTSLVLNTYLAYKVIYINFSWYLCKCYVSVSQIRKLMHINGLKIKLP